MNYEEFEAEILNLTGIDLVLYKENQMRRRINTLIERLGMDGYDSYLDMLRMDAKSLDYFLDYITINVTEFFRTRDQWNYMADNVIPALPDDAVIWSCACSSGEEPYSLAMSIAMRRPLSDIRIIATDIDDSMLDIARKGVYTQRTMANVYDGNIDRFFTKRSVPANRGEKTCYRVTDEIRHHVEFRRLNLLCDDFPQGCNLIVCRNVLIYFTDEAKQMLYRRFNDSLCPGGYLFTGHTEQMLRFGEYGFTKERNFLFRKISAVSRKAVSR